VGTTIDDVEGRHREDQVTLGAGQISQVSVKWHTLYARPF
jgi:hypothetical protein